MGKVEVVNLLKAGDTDSPPVKHRQRKSIPEGPQVTIQTCDGLYLRKANLDYQGLKTLVEPGYDDYRVKTK